MTVISVDIETDGPAAGVNSMISIGLVAFNDDGDEEGSLFQAFPQRVSRAMNKDTMDWWSKQDPTITSKAFSGRHPFNYKEAMQNIFDFVSSYDDPFWIAWSAPFDYQFVNEYSMEFLGKQLAFTFLDIKVLAYARGMIFTGFKECTSSEAMSWYPNIVNENPHDPIEDARTQGKLYFAIEKDLRSVYSR